MAGRATGGFGTVTALDRGLRTLAAFSATRPELTVSDVAREVGVDRSTARRMLLTLVELGFVTVDEQIFRLHPSCLRLGRSYLDGLALPEMSLPYLRRLGARTRETALLGVLDADEFVVVSRAPSSRLMAASSSVGDRFPAMSTAGGRVLLADRSHGPGADPDPVLRGVHEQGFATGDELLAGTRAVAVAVRDADGRAAGAAVIAAHASRCTVESLVTDVLPHLRTEADALATAWRDRAVAVRG